MILIKATIKNRSIRYVDNPLKLQSLQTHHHLLFQELFPSDHPLYLLCKKIYYTV